jgi:hypothetical protein
MAHTRSPTGPANSTRSIQSETRQRKSMWWRRLGAHEPSSAPDKLAPGTVVTEPSSAQNLIEAAWRSMREHILLVVAFSAAINVLYLAPSLFMLQVYDRVLPSQGLLTLVFLGLVLVGALATMTFLDSSRASVLARASLRLATALRQPALRAFAISMQFAKGFQAPRPLGSSIFPGPHSSSSSALSSTSGSVFSPWAAPSSSSPSRYSTNVRSAARFRYSRRRLSSSSSHTRVTSTLPKPSMHWARRKRSCNGA